LCRDGDLGAGMMVINLRYVVLLLIFVIVCKVIILIGQSRVIVTIDIVKN
jgi:hypothetical protein